MLLEGLRDELVNVSVALPHDGLLVSPTPTQSLLTRLHLQALNALQLESDGTPFLHLINTAEQYVKQLQELTPATQQQIQIFTYCVLGSPPSAWVTCATTSAFMPWPSSERNGCKGVRRIAGSVSHSQGVSCSHAPGDDESGVSLPPSTNSEVEERVEESVFMEVYSTTRIASTDLVNGKDLQD